jgi:hypothetical protein
VPSPTLIDAGFALNPSATLDDDWEHPLRKITQ